MPQALLTRYALSHDNCAMKRKVNTYAALLCITLIGAAATITIVRYANAVEYPPGFGYSGLMPETFPE